MAIKSIVFQGRKEFTAETYSAVIRNNSSLARQDAGFIKGYGEQLGYTLIGTNQFRLKDGLFQVAGRLNIIELGTVVDVVVPLQVSSTKGYIIAKIQTSLPIGENLSIEYKLGDATNFPTLTQDETYEIPYTTNATYEMALYSFTIDGTSMTSIVKLVRPITNTPLQVAELSSDVADDLLDVGGIFLKKETDGSYTQYYKSGVATTVQMGAFNYNKININGSSATDVPIIINAIVGQTAALSRWLVNSIEVSYIDAIGRYVSDYGISNRSSGNNATVYTLSTGVVISRNVADANPAARINQVHASSTGNLLELQLAGIAKAFFLYDGSLKANNYFNLVSANFSKMRLQDTGVLLERNVNDSNVAVIINQNQGTGDILRGQYAYANKFVVNKDGYFGIGYSTPSYSIDVLTSIDAPAIRATRLTTNTNSVGNLVMIKRSTSGDMIDGFGSGIGFFIQDNAVVENEIARISAYRRGGDISGAFAIMTNNGGSLTEKFTILPDGKVGIGKTTPLAPLEVKRTAISAGEVVTPLFLSNGYTAEISGIALKFGYDGAGLDGYGHRIVSYSNPSASRADYLSFEIANGVSSYLEGMRLTKDGYLAIGTTTPAAGIPLHVASDGVTQLVLSGKTSTNNRLLIGFNVSGLYGTIQAITEGTAYRNLILQPNGANVGIGNTNPLHKLDVNGNINIPTGSLYLINGVQHTHVLNNITNPSDNTVWSMGGNTLTMNFTNPVGGLSLNMTGGWSDHVFEIMDTSSVPDGSIGDHLAHFETSRVNVVPLHIAHNHANGVALEVTGKSYFSSNVGIGISPSYALDVSSTIQTRMVRTTTSDASANASVQLLVRATSLDMVDGFGLTTAYGIRDSAGIDNYIAFIGAVRSGADNSGRIIFRTLSAGVDSEKMTILPSGEVLIGTTTSVGTKLAVAGSIATTTGSVYSNSIRPYSGTLLTILSGGSDIAYFNGKVGVGINAPSSQLHVHVATSSDSTLILSNSVSGTTTNDGLHLWMDGTNSGVINKENGYFSIGTNNVERIRVTSIGNVGIAIDLPLYKLHVNGDVGINGHLYDSDASAGTDGQVLSRDSGGIKWRDPKYTDTYLASGSVATTASISLASAIQNFDEIVLKVTASYSDGGIIERAVRSYAYAKTADFYYLLDVGVTDIREGLHYTGSNYASSTPFVIDILQANSGGTAVQMIVTGTATNVTYEIIGRNY